VLFVHAGVRPGVPLHAQADEDLIWIRDEFLNFRGYFEQLIVHGHTPVMEPEVLSNRINIDTGAYATGRLSCLVLQDEALTFL
jgi:serine/threonine protein phosphatase 1